MAITSTIFICAIALLFQNVSGAYIDPSYDRIAPWARTFLAWRKANTNVAGGRLSPLLRNIPRVCSTICDDIPLPGAYISSGLIPSIPGLAVTSASRGPIGISILSENIIEGPLAVAGELPFMGAVDLGGALPTAGSGAVSYGTDCANDALSAARAGLLGYNRFGSRYNEFDRFGFC